jgi:hypothetical protein
VLHRPFDAPLQRHRIGAGGDVLRTFADDRLRKNRSRRRSITGDVGRLARDFTHHAGAEILDRILQVDLLGDGDAVLGDGGRSEFLVEHDVAALGAERHLDCVRQLIHAAKQRVTRTLAVDDLLCHSFDS